MTVVTGKWKMWFVGKCSCKSQFPLSCYIIVGHLIHMSRQRYACEMLVLFVLSFMQTYGGGILIMVTIIAGRSNWCLHGWGCYEQVSRTVACKDDEGARCLDTT